MKKVLVLIILFALFLASIVTAEENLESLLLEGTEDLTGQERIDAQKQIVSENLDLLAIEIEKMTARLPGILKSFMGNLRLNIYLEDEMVVGIVMQDTKVAQIQNGEIQDPNFNVHISDKAFQDLNEGNANFKSLLKSGDVSYNGVGFVGKMKSGLLTAALKVTGNGASRKI